MQHKQQHRHYHPPSAQPSDLIAYLRISYVHKSPEKKLAKRRRQAAFGCKPRQHLGFQQRRFKASMYVGIYLYYGPDHLHLLLF